MFELARTSTTVTTIDLGGLLNQRNQTTPGTGSRRDRRRKNTDHGKRGRRDVNVPRNLPRRRSF